MKDAKPNSVKRMIEFTEREIAILMVITATYPDIRESDTNATYKELQAIAEKFRKASWDNHYHRQRMGLSTFIEDTGILKPPEDMK